MKNKAKTLWSVLAITGFALCSPGLVASTWHSHVSEQRTSPTVKVISRSTAGLSVSLTCPGFLLENTQTEMGYFSRITCPETPSTGQVGLPQVPVVRKLFCVPEGAGVEFTSDIVSSSQLELTCPIIPAQGHLSVNSSLDHHQVISEKPDSPGISNLISGKLQIDMKSYSKTQEYHPVRITLVGPAGDMDLYLLELFPIHYDPIVNSLTLAELIHVDLRFDVSQASESERFPKGLEDAVLNPPLRTPRGVENFLIIAAPDFVGSSPLDQFIAAKTAQGYNVLTYYPPFDTYYLDIRAYIQSLWETAESPDYVLLVGDGYDRWDVTNNNIPYFRGSGSKRGVTDQVFVCMDGAGDWIPDIPIGRLSAGTIADLQAMVNKILYVDSGYYSDPSYAGRSVFLTGISEGMSYHEQVIQNFTDPAGITPMRVYALDGATTEDFSNAINAGASLVNMFGHAAGCQAWGSPLFVFDDIEALVNTDKYPFVLCFNCSGGAFQYDEESGCSPGFLEKMMVEEFSGAAAAYGNTMNQDPYTWDSWGILYQEWLRALYANGHREIGNAMMAARANFIAYYGVADPVSHDWTECFNILGDPSMKLPLPQAKKLLIVTPPLFSGSAALNEYIDQKTNMGLEVLTYTVPVGTSNTMIKTYIQSLWQTPDQPDYITIIGDTAGSVSDNGTIPHFTGLGYRQADTDWPYGCMDSGDDWYPDIPVGRISVTSTSSLNDVVKKIKHVESGSFSDPDYILRGNFIAHSSTYGQAEPTHDYVIDTYLTPHDYAGNKIYASLGGTASDITDGVSQGSMFTVYFGHSGSSGWSEPGFYGSDVNALSNQGLYGLVMGWSCNTAHYSYDECFGETWLRVADKGAVTYISASNYIYWSSAADWAPAVSMEKAFFAALFDDNIWTVGDAWIRTQRRFLEDYGEWNGQEGQPPAQNEEYCRDFMEEFVILGDPTLQLPRPNSFGLVFTDHSFQICSPDDIQCTIDIQKIGAYGELVTLSATGAPSGLNLAFSFNNEVPPFTTVLTLSNTEQVEPGRYSLSIIAEGADGTTKIEDIAIHFSSNPPSSFGLSAPANGSVGNSRQPVFSWEESESAAEYWITVAEDSEFNSVVLQDQSQNPVYISPVLLEADRTYFWKILAENGCGSTESSETFSFVTIDQADYFTELFYSGFDLDGYSLTFLPNGGASYFYPCLEPIAALPSDPTGGVVYNLNDDGSQVVTPSEGIPFYGTSYDSFYINANGNITFTRPDGTFSESINTHFSLQRISAVFDDLHPGQGGVISSRELGDRIAITWESVPQINTADSNTFQVELFYEGKIRVSWLGIGTHDMVVGLSNSDSIPDDFVQSNVSEYEECPESFTGACCVDSACNEMLEVECLAADGTFWGMNTTCEPDPCKEYDPCCLIISEIVQGKESGDCPRWVEITNSGIEGYFFSEGGLIIQEGNETDTTVDVDLTGIYISSGDSLVIASNVEGMCTGAFTGVYGEAPDLATQVPFGFGTERLMLSDRADGSHVFDIYGEFGTDGSGLPWEFTAGYSFRDNKWIRGTERHFIPDDWTFGGPGSLEGSNPTALLLSLTTPGTHSLTGTCTFTGDLDGNEVVDLFDFQVFEKCFAGPEQANESICDAADLDRDRDIDLYDFSILSWNFGQ